MLPDAEVVHYPIYPYLPVFPHNTTSTEQETLTFSHNAPQNLSTSGLHTWSRIDHSRIFDELV